MKTFLIEAIPLLRDALTQQLSEHQHISDLQAFSNIPMALAACSEEEKPELLWLDGTLLDAKSEQTIKTFRRAAPQIKVLIFGSGESVLDIKNYYKQGILAYLSKTATAEDICAALTEVAEGHLYVPPSLADTFAAWLVDPLYRKKPKQSLTRREKEVLNLIVEEHTAHEIAGKLFISQCTVDTHRINLIQKLGVKNTAGLVRVACEAGLYQRSGDCVIRQ